MKKRKRKMKQNKLKCLPDVTLFWLLIAFLLIQDINCLSDANESLTATASELFDEEHHLLNLSLPIAPVALETNPKATSISLESHSSNKISAGSSSLEIDELLAVESSRLLTIGKQKQSPQHQQPPYEASLIKPQISSQTTKQHLNDSQLARLYRAQASIKRLQPLQDIRLGPLKLNQLASDYSHHLSAPYLNSAPPSISSWPSFYFTSMRINGPATGTHSSAEIGSKQQEQRSLGQAEVAGARATGNNGVLNGSAQNNSASPFEYEAIESNSNNGTAAKFASSNSDRSKFPSLLSSNGEDEFEKSLLSGNYQRTNSSNMSWSQLVKQATESNVMESLMVTNKSIVSLLCDTNDMLVRIKFKQPFRGIVLATNDNNILTDGRNGRKLLGLDNGVGCRLIGTGAQYYEMRIGLHGCGTRQEMPRLFINNIQIQYSNSSQQLYRAAANSSRSSSSSPTQFGDLQPDAEDVEEVVEVKTIVCSYPIRPRAPAPPGLPSERIVLSEQSGDQQRQQQRPNSSAAAEPAKLVHYEPLVLISGLLFLSLTLLGLTTSAYLFTKRYKAGSQLSRRRRGFNFGANEGTAQTGKGPMSSPATSAQLYRASPAQTANLPIAPPLISVRSAEGFAASSERRLRRYNKQQKPRTCVKRYPDGSVEGGAAISIDPAVSMANEAADSLTDSKSSVTTIDIPFSNNNKFGPSKTIVRIPIEMEKASTSDDGLPVSIRHTADNDGLIEFSSVRSLPNRSTFVLKRAHKTATRASQLASKEVQVGGNTPPFGSLKVTLTSPSEFRRLQGIARLFNDEAVAESKQRASNDYGKKGTGNKRYALAKSDAFAKYKSKIEHRLDEQERRLVCKALTRDELFRSLVVESVDRETFCRKLRENPSQSGRFKQTTWDLLEEILLDDKFTPTMLSYGIEDGEQHHHNKARAQSAILDTCDPSDSQLSTAPQKDLEEDDPNSKRVDSAATTKALSEAAAGESGQQKSADLESVLAEVDVRQTAANDANSLSHQDSLDSDEKTKGTLTSKRFTNKYDKEEERGGHESHELTRSRLANDNSIEQSIVRVSQFNPTRHGGLTGTLINIDSVTSFTSSQTNFSTYTRSSIEHTTRYEDSLPFVDDNGDYDDGGEEQTSRIPSKVSWSKQHDNNNDDNHDGRLPLKKATSRQRQQQGQQGKALNAEMSS